MKLKDLTGNTFSRLTVISRSTKKHKRIYWNCICICGNDVVVASNHLRSNATKSCGCHKEKVNGMSRSREYKIWQSMKDRCKNPNNPSSRNYIERGISFCKNWESFNVFFGDMGVCPTGFSIDRIDNNGDYTPDNCRWASDITQGRNKRTNKIISFMGESQPLSAWAEFLNIKKSTLNARFIYGWSTEDAFMTPVNHVRNSLL